MSKDIIEKRAQVTELRMMQGEDGKESRTVEGYAVVYDDWTTIGDNYFREKISPGALTNTLRNSDIRLLFNHDTSQLLAREKSQTLRVKEDNQGLYFIATIPESRDDILEMIKRGDLDECSFAFRVGKQTWTWAEETEGITIDERVIEEISAIPEITLAPFGAYKNTSVGLRSKEAALEERNKAKAERESQEQDEKRKQIEIETAMRDREIVLRSYIF
jgi:HK97 family phage prohead protease